jgi:MarR family transcriptional regulator for hemolysin
MQKREPIDLEVLATPGHLISLAARAFERLSELRLKPFGFGVGYVPVLVAIKEAKAESQRDLARFAKVEQPSMAQMLARMERDGLVKRTPDPHDGRSSRVTLTETAKTRLPKACAVLFQGNRDVLSDFTDEESAQLTALLARLINNLDRVIAADAPPTRKIK